ncbi:protein translocase subunit SecD [Aquiluna borgnonia]|uniref:Protein translocase subunit SecD n=1 Tax=Aquiluna borgnonia TaxID=2499157 RepID=A0A7D4TU60_9MICO|nr:protein translocase subunit SecD [Aquiluna borgnonia]QKJ25255.1 protein translocase subunit SecD [Aquiluna borgnonia]
MSERTTEQSAKRKLGWLGAVAAFFTGLIIWGVVTVQPGASFAPELALDLQGGTQIILTPTLADGQVVEQEQLDQAVTIIRQRIDGSGVGEAQVSVQGNQNIVVSIPGAPDANTLQLIKASALLEFRPVITYAASAAPSTESAAVDISTLNDTPATTPVNASDAAWITEKVQAQFDQLDCSTEFRSAGQVDDPTKPLVTCDDFYLYKYILGPVEVNGLNISNAYAGTVTTTTGASTNDWAVNLEFDATGTESFGQVTARLFGLPSPQNQFAITLDGLVITAPATNAVITNGQAQITGNFTQESATALSDQLKYGALPIGFEVQSQENISATLGEESLRSGLIAGVIGLIVVVVYMTFQYRGLASVVLGSLIVAAILVYLAVAFLSWRQGYRLSLAGVAGLIVAIGITADSFIVYFERIRDELREGRTLETAVEAGWKRALRTILVSDAVSLTAAVVLYLLTSSSVRGFAFTLGLTTLIDLMVVTLFTHPLVQVLARKKFFASGHKWSGFDLSASKAAYLGRAQFRVSEKLAEGKAEKASKEARKRQTIAERKAQEVTND